MIGNESAMNLTRKAIEEHWRASDNSDTEAEYAIYAVDAILDYPQSGERFKGLAAISAQRGGHPADRQFTVLRISGDGHLWFARELVVHETQYFAEKFSVPTWRAALAEPIPGGHIEER
ncbi:unnamed protein product [Penicillium pancosmium]